MQLSPSEKFALLAPNTETMKSVALVLLFVAAVHAETIVEGYNVTAANGEDAHIPCIYTAKSDVTPKFEWYHGTQRLYHAQGPGDKYADSGASTVIDPDRLSVDEVTGELTIKDVTYNDNYRIPTLYCKASFGQDGADPPHTLYIVVPKLQTEDPTTSLDSDQAFDIHDRSQNLGQCSTTATYPGANIDFYKNGEMIKVGGGLSFLDQPLCDKDSEGTMQCKKELSKVIEASDHQAEFVCAATVEYFGKKFVRRSTFKKFNVTHATTKATISSNSEFAFAGKEMTVACKANGYPLPEIRIKGEVRSSYTFVATKEMDGTTITCEASNQGAGADPVTDTYTLNVLSVEEPVITGENEVMLDEAVAVSCAAQGDGTPTVAWFMGDTKISNNGQLNFEKASFENSGLYVCKAANDHKELERVSEFMLDVTGIKLTGKMETEVQGKKGDTVELDCLVESNPQAVITWDVPGSEGSLTVKSGFNYSSEITLGPLTEDHSEKTYTCTAVNDDGGKVIKSFKMPLVADAASPTAGIIIAILVIILVVAIILAVLYNKGIICKKQEKGEESAEGDIAVEINNDEGDVEAGNGKPVADEQPANEEEKLMNGHETSD